MSKIYVIAYTDNGKKLADKLCETLADCMVISNKEIDKYWAKDNAFIFVGAAGIAVRSIAPFIKDKLTDPAVLVMDELGMNVIPILSGHVGGANALAEKIENVLGANAIITTATDINGVSAIDEWAKENELEIKNRSGIKAVSMKLLKGEAVSVCLSDDVVVSDEKPDNATLWLKPKKQYVVGMGCRKEKEFESLFSFLEETIKELNISFDSIIAIASIDVKKNEPGLVKLAERLNIPFVTYEAEQLKNVPGEFEESEFVENTVGVSDVSARAAKLCGNNGRFVLKKKKSDGMTISVFEKYKRVTLQYEKN